MPHKTKTIGASLALLAAMALATAQPAVAEESSEPVPGVEKDKNLSDQLHKKEGVIEPPPDGDPGIHVPAPDPEPGTTPVIPPPGSPGGDPNVQPK